ncbi:MAG TPA: hypothetical protein VFU96_09675 [Acidimicrobiia bacterium]|nr:hypothetical protein [Acidimicrobiia bacterium]
MEPERHETYERIPWETLEEKKPDRQWLMMAVAGAVVLGALAYSFMSSRPAPVPVTSSVAPVDPEITVPLPPPAQAMAPAVPSTAPIVTAEADLYAVHPERVIDRAVAHAEWFVAEYLTVDGSDEGRAALTALTPTGVPLPTATEGARVFVEWVRASAVEEIGQLLYRVTVLARSLAAAPNAEYQRQAPLQIEVDVSVAGEAPQVVMAPRVSPAPSGPAHQLALAPVPDEVGAAALQQAGASEVVGGKQAPDGAWQVVVLAEMPDGVSRPVSVLVPPP